MVMQSGTRIALEDTSDPRYGYRHIRYNADERSRRLNQHRNETLWNHASPQSVYVAAIGNHWKQGSWQHVVDMVHHTNSYGFPCALDEIMDRCFDPYDSLGAMRNEAVMRGMQGFDWTVMIDNDIYPEPDLIIRLIERATEGAHPIIAPYVAEPSSGKPLHGPHTTMFTGIQPVRWTVLSMLVFRTGVWNCTGPEFWNNAIGADEGYHFQKLWHYGFQPVIDTDIVLPVGNDPTYPLASLRMQPRDAETFWNSRRQYLLSMPDRRPVFPNDPRVSEHGEYMPFLAPNQAQAAIAPPPTPNGDIDALKRAHMLMGEERRHGNDNKVQGRRLQQATTGTLSRVAGRSGKKARPRNNA